MAFVLWVLFNSYLVDLGGFCLSSEWRFWLWVCLSDWKTEVGAVQGVQGVLGLVLRVLVVAV